MRDRKCETGEERGIDSNGEEKRERGGQTEREGGKCEEGERRADYQTLSTCTLPHGNCVSVSVCVSHSSQPINLK